MKKSKKLRKFLVGHANTNGGKTVLFFFAKSKKEGHPLGPPVNVSFEKMVVTRENHQHGHSVHAKKLTDSLCEKIIRFSRELELNVFFSVPALIKNTRKYDDITGLGSAFLDDIPADTLSEDMLTKGMNIGDFSFPVSAVIQTSPGNCQVLWNFKGFLPADERYKGPQPPFLPALPKHRKDLFNRMLRLLKKRLEGDPGGSNLNQIYRLPFTLNHKPKYSPAPEVKLRYSDFSPENRINFGEFYTELLIPELKKHYQNNFENIFTKIHKNNDWILIENLLGWGESAENLGHSWTANERDMSAAKRLLEHYKIPRETIQKLIIQSPNREKGQKKGSQYFNSLFKKLKTPPTEKKGNSISVRGYDRSTIDLIRVFSNIPALLFSNKPTVTIKGIKTPDGRKVDVERVGKIGMNNKRVKILLWSLSNARVRAKNKYVGRTIEIDYEDFSRDMLEVAPEDYETKRKFKKTAAVYYGRTVKGLEFLRFGISDYYQLEETGNAKAVAISPFQSFEKKGDKVIITLSPEMETVYSDPERLKRVEKKFLIFIGESRDSLIPAFALWLGENFYDTKNAGSKIKIKPADLKHLLQGRPGGSKPKKMSDSSRSSFRDDMYRAVHLINKKEILIQVGSSARKVDMKSSREATEFEFTVTQIQKHKDVNT